MVLCDSMYADSVVGTLKPCLMQKNLIGDFAVIGSKDVKILGMHTCAIFHTWREHPVPPGGIHST